MKTVQQSFELMNSLNEDYSLDNVYRFIEMCAKTCYKSEFSAEDDISKSFVGNLIAKDHLAMLEHGTIYMRIPLSEGVASSFFIKNPYSKVNIVEDARKDRAYFVTTNLRVIVENSFSLDKIKNWYLCKPTINHFLRYTGKFIISRQIANEFVRHRAFSFAQESSRFCNYSNENKFSDNIVFIEPVFLKDKPLLSSTYYLNYLKKCEELYLSLKEKGWSTEEVSTLLPSITKTELVMTGFKEDWNHFFNLRVKGTTGKPHIMAKEVASKAMEIIEKLQ